MPVRVTGTGVGTVTLPAARTKTFAGAWVRRAASSTAGAMRRTTRRMTAAAGGMTAAGTMAARTVRRITLPAAAVALRLTEKRKQSYQSCRQQKLDHSDRIFHFRFEQRMTSLSKKPITFLQEDCSGTRHPGKDEFHLVPLYL